MKITAWFEYYLDTFAPHTTANLYWILDHNREDGKSNVDSCLAIEAMIALGED